MKVHLYIMFDGNCAQAFDFYNKVFDEAELESKTTFADSPFVKEMNAEARKDLKEEDTSKIMHMGLRLTKDMTLMGCDNPPAVMKCDSSGDKDKFVVGTNMQIYLEANSKEHADMLITALSADGGKIKMPMASTFWGAYFGMCKDAFGITWMLSFPTESTDTKD